MISLSPKLIILALPLRETAPSSNKNDGLYKRTSSSHNDFYSDRLISPLGVLLFYPYLRLRCINAATPQKISDQFMDKNSIYLEKHSANRFVLLVLIAWKKIGIFC